MNLLKHCHRPLARLASTLNQAASVSTFPTSNNSSDCETTAAFRDPVRQVFISQSTDVFTNLALEDWLYRHHDFDHKVRQNYL